jgi:DNA mismatch endonuclease (patch repair protein)
VPSAVGHDIFMKHDRPLRPFQSRRALSGRAKGGGPGPISAGRSRTMSSIRGRGNRTTELRMAGELRRARLSGWRRHLGLFGTPDFVWRRERLALFVDGCFWHGCPRCYRSPRHNASFWRIKVTGNRDRDKRVTRSLRAAGWTVIRVWECRIGNRVTIARIASSLAIRRPAKIT